MITEIPDIDHETYLNQDFVSGLNNIGNTCYINSCFQILSHTYELSHYLKDADIQYNPEIPETIAFIEWMEIKNILLGKKCVISPFKCINGLQHLATLKNSVIARGEQNDICEFLMFMLESFHTPLTGSKTIEYEEYLNYINTKHSIISDKCYKLLQSNCFNNYSCITNLFYGIQINAIQQKSNHDILSINPELISIIQLDIPSDILQPTLHDCLDLYCTPVPLEDANAYYNEPKKEYVSALKGVLFWQLPHIMIFTFNRTRVNGNGKNNKLIHFPIQNLDMMKYMAIQDNVTYNYELYGVGCHDGGLSGGHYTACVKHFDKWYHCNDDIISPLQNPLQLINPNVYCLFYRKTFSSV